MPGRSVLVADSNTRLSQLVGQLLADEPGFRVLGVLNSGDEACRVAREQRPDMILLSERLQGRSTADLCQRLRQLVPEAVLVMWTHDPTSHARDRVDVDGLVERGTTFRQFVRDLQAAFDRAVGSPAATEQTWADERLPPLPPPPNGYPDGALRDDTDGGGGLLLTCDSCVVQVRLTADDMAPAVDAARAFFVQHERCNTGIDLSGRSALSFSA